MHLLGETNLKPNCQANVSLKKDPWIFIHRCIKLSLSIYSSCLKSPPNS